MWPAVPMMAWVVGEAIVRWMLHRRSHTQELLTCSTSQELAGIVRVRRYEFALPGSLMHLPWCGTRLARGDHFVGIDKDSERSAVEIRRVLHVLDRGPSLRVVADIDLDAVAVGILVVESGLRPFVDRELRHYAERLEPGIGSQQFVERPELERNMLQSSMLRALGIGR